MFNMKLDITLENYILIVSTTGSITYFCIDQKFLILFHLFVFIVVVS